MSVLPRAKSMPPLLNPRIKLVDSNKLLYITVSLRDFPLLLRNLHIWRYCFECNLQPELHSMLLQKVPKTGPRPVWPDFLRHLSPSPIPILGGTLQPRLDPSGNSCGARAEIILVWHPPYALHVNHRMYAYRISARTWCRTRAEVNYACLQLFERSVEIRTEFVFTYYKCPFLFDSIRVDASLRVLEGLVRTCPDSRDLVRISCGLVFYLSCPNPQLGVYAPCH